MQVMISTCCRPDGRPLKTATKTPLDGLADEWRAKLSDCLGVPDSDLKFTDLIKIID